MKRVIQSKTGKARPYIAFFDLDDTILDGNSGRHFIKFCRERGLYSASDYIRIGLSSLAYKTGLLSSENLIRRWARQFGGWEEHALQNFTEEFFRTALIPRIRDNAVTEIESHRKRKARLVLLSASNNFVCEPMKKALGLDDVLCTRLEVTHGRLTGELDGPFVYGVEKQVAMEGYCRMMKINPADCYYYGDAYTDRFILESVGNPYCVNPAPELRKLALQRGWPLLEWS